MTILPVATINAMPSRAPMVACARVSLGTIKRMTAQGHLEACLADLWRRTRLCCNTTRHLDPRLFNSPCIERSGRYWKDKSQIIDDMAETENIRGGVEEKREAARSIDTMWGANDDR